MGLTLYIILISIISIIKSSYERKGRYEIIILLSLELLLIAIALFLIFSSIYIDNIFGLYFSILLLSLGAIETAIGLSLLLYASS